MYQRYTRLSMCSSCKSRGAFACLCQPLPASRCRSVCLTQCSCLYLPIPPIPNTGANFASEGAGYSPHQIHTCQAGKGAIPFRWHHLLLVAVCTSCLAFSCWCRTPLDPPSTDQRWNVSFATKLLSPLVLRKILSHSDKHDTTVFHPYLTLSLWSPSQKSNRIGAS